ncbi:cytochrome oxidase putative small subunit CydP [Tepidiphilus sp. J10]|uniref:cytochrome oxidase putative small subunit CydP n=1 Tax=Tepidiphilus sp. J10 TaxID=2502185 RepID=UPI00115CEB89|nr:cytochrome oxidase putative small subunit CydP [Tepidiphilus sp. J10]
METETLARRLRREIVVVLLLKLFLLTALWWVFVRDARVEVGAERMQAQAAGAPSSFSKPSSSSSSPVLSASQEP